MGYFKNQLIAEQVEVGDRVPAPRPATSHVAFPTRRQRIEAQRLIRENLEKQTRDLYVSAAVYFGIGVALGVFVGVMI